jgi:hypothetical protein
VTGKSANHSTGTERSKFNIAACYVSWSPPVVSEFAVIIVAFSRGLVCTHNLDLGCHAKEFLRERAPEPEECKREHQVVGKLDTVDLDQSTGFNLGGTASREHAGTSRRRICLRVFRRKDSNLVLFPAPCPAKGEAKSTICIWLVCRHVN